MGSATTPALLRFLHVPDPRFKWSAYSTALSTVTQAGPKPGVPEAQDNSELVLEAVGSTGPTVQMNVQTIRAGHPGTDRARFLWKYGGDAATRWRGGDPPVSLSGFEFIERTTTAGKWRNFHARALDDGKIVVVADESLRYVRAWIRDPDTGNWDENDIYDRGSAQTYSLNPCVVVLPNQKLLTYFWVEDASGDYQISAYQSVDAGATWSVAQEGCLSDSISTATYHPGRLRADVLKGQIMLVAAMAEQGGPEDVLRQYASNDLGATFDLVVEWTGADRNYPDVISYGGRLHVAYVAAGNGTTAIYVPHLVSVGSAYEDMSGVDPVLMQDTTDPMEWGTQAGGVFTVGELSLWADEDGVMWVIGREHEVGANANSEVAVRASFDAGETWGEVGGGPADHEGTSTWRGMDDATYPSNLAACAHRGRAIVLHNCQANPGPHDASIMALWLGGYTTVCLAQEAGKGTVSPRTVTGWTDTWLPYDYPQDGPTWTATSTGTPSWTTTGMRLVTGNPQTEQRQAVTIAGTLAQGLTVLAQFQLVTAQCRVEARISDATPLEYEVAVIVTGTEIKLWDLKAGAIIGAAVTTTDGLSTIQVLLDVYADNAIAFYRVVGASGDREWTPIASTGTLTSAAVNNGHRVRFGQTDDSNSIWSMVAYSSSTYTGKHIYGQDNPNDLLGRNYMPTPVFVDEGLRLQAVDGPTMRGEEWNVDPDAEYAVANIFPDVAGSPRRPWRSTTDQVAAEIVWEPMDSLGTSATHLMGALLSCYLGEANFGVATLWGKNAADAWVSIATLTLSVRTGLRFARDNQMITPDIGGGNAANVYFPTDILAGSHIYLDDASANPDVVRKIRHNSPGVWTPGSNSLQTRILLDSVATTDPAFGTAAQLWSKDYLGIIPNTTLYKAFKLKIPVQTTAEGYFTLGVWSMGHAYPIGGFLMEYGRGRGLEWAPSVEMTEGRTGIRTVQALGPTRRAVEIAWVDGVETSGLTDTSPNWIIGWTGGNAVAVPADVPWSIPGLLERLQGANTPIVYCAAAALPSSGTAIVDITDRRLLLYGRIVTESIRADNVLGNEVSTELLRLGTARIEEET